MVAGLPPWAQIAGALGVAGGLVALAGAKTIAMLRAWGQRQRIRDDAPTRHRDKAGTPTMGGVLIVAAITAAALLLAGPRAPVLFALAALLGFGAIGLWDDLVAVQRNRNLGLRARERLALQLALGFALAWIAARQSWLDTAVSFPGLGEVDLGRAYVIFAGLLFVGFTNAVNLTDGLDGLAAQLVAIAALGFFAIALMRGLVPAAVVAIAVAGACAGFLPYNAYPARVFMGDVGSNALGGVLAALAIITGAEIGLFVIGGVFVAVAASVILQVAYFKVTGGRRIFRMSPLHHHFELVGWSEPTIVRRFTWAGVLCNLIGVLVTRR
ncbi:MAG: phospho-N-acetylmuramoyl-pentapeptide-transferase [Armatimonadota bacterium]